MTEVIHHFIERYGLIAVFLGCLAEGESAAILGGFFAHQQVFLLWQTFTAAFLGAFISDTTFFILGRRFARHAYVKRLSQRPGFSHASRLLLSHPNLFILGNRYIYGMRLVGGIAAGISGIAVPRFIALNAASALVWATLFSSIGYIFGLGAESIIGRTLVHHERLLIALGIGVVGIAVTALVRHHFAYRERIRQ